MGIVDEFVEEFGYEETFSYRKIMALPEMALPELEEFEDREFDDIAGIYVLYEDGEIAYIGESDFAFKRVCEHRYEFHIGKPGAFPFGNKFKILRCIHEGKRKAMEAGLITKHKPKYNKVHNGDYGPVSKEIRLAIKARSARLMALVVAPEKRRA
jgi:hypothetical protein